MKKTIDLMFAIVFGLACGAVTFFALSLFLAIVVGLAGWSGALTTENLSASVRYGPLLQIIFVVAATAVGISNGHRVFKKRQQGKTSTDAS